MDLGLALSVDAENPIEGDLQLVNGSFVWVTDLATLVAQKLRIRFAHIKGEWFLDTREGIPYLTEIMGVKNPSQRVLRAIFANVVLTTPGIATLDSLTVAIDTATRTLSINIKARLDNGHVFSSDDYGPFLVRF